MYAHHGIVNPEFLSIINPRAGPRKILFHANEVQVGEHHQAAISADFAQFICARRIVLYTSFLDEPHRNNIFRFITGTGNTLERVRIHSFGANKGEFCEFLVKVKLWKFIFIIPNFI
jgi:hypothetical protein